MVTNLVESGKSKCAQYWPDTTTDEQLFGPFVVHLVEEQTFPNFIKRNIAVKVCLMQYQTTKHSL